MKIKSSICQFFTIDLNNNIAICNTCDYFCMVIIRKYGNEMNTSALSTSGSSWISHLILAKSGFGRIPKMPSDASLLSTQHSTMTTGCDATHHMVHFCQPRLVNFFVLLKYPEWLKLETFNFVHWLDM